uniref:WD_REPEATS_REGION domain-containing protein n=1 Tax=Trichuris muris TaxID=70415 RepID=A0A5S6QTE9_TRIMR
MVLPREPVYLAEAPLHMTERRQDVWRSLHWRSWLKNPERRIVAFALDDSVLAWCSEPDVVSLLDLKLLDGSAVQLKDKLRECLATHIRCRSRVTALCFGCAVLKEGSATLGFRRSVRRRSQATLQLLAIGLESGRIRIHLADSGQLVTELLDHVVAVKDLAFSPSDSACQSLLLSCSNDSTLKLWNMCDGGNMFRTLQGHRDGEFVLCCCWSPDGLWAASGGTDCILVVWRTRDWSISHRLKLHRNFVVDCEFSPDAALVISCSHDTTAVIFDHIKGVPLVTLRHEIPIPRTVFACSINEHNVLDLSISSDGKHIVTLCSDGNMRVWNIASPQLPCKVLPVRKATSVSYSRDGTAIAVCLSNGEVQLFSAPMSVQRLSFLCRKKLRFSFCWDKLQHCLLPSVLRSFLAYDELRHFRDCRPVLPSVEEQ